MANTIEEAIRTARQNALWHKALADVLSKIKPGRLYHVMRPRWPQAEALALPMTDKLWYSNGKIRVPFKMLAYRERDGGSLSSVEDFTEEDLVAEYVTLEPVGLEFLPVVLGWRWHDPKVDRMLRDGRLPKGMNR